MSAKSPPRMWPNGKIEPGSKAALYLATLAKRKWANTLLRIDSYSLSIRISEGVNSTGPKGIPRKGIFAEIPKPDGTGLSTATTDAKMVFSVLKYGADHAKRDGNTLKITLKNGTTVKTSQLVDVSDIPEQAHDLPIVGEITANHEDLAGLLVAAQVNNVREYFNGVNLNLDGTLVCTDGFRMHTIAKGCKDVKKVPCPYGNDPRSPIVHKLPLTHAIKAKCGGPLVVLSDGENSALEVFDKNRKHVFTVTAVTIDSGYLEWRRVLPKATHEKFNLERAPFDKLAKQAKELESFGGSDNDKSIATFTRDSGTLAMSRAGVEVSHNGQVDGDAFTFLMDQNLLSDGLTFTHGKKWEAATVEGSDPCKQFQIKAGNKTAVIMPVRRE